MNYEQELQDVADRAYAIIAVLTAKIAEFPGNPRITRLGGSSNCFTIMSSDLGESWAPEYHDFKLQYKFIVKALNKAALHRAPAIIATIIDTGRYNIGEHNMKFHPDVVRHLTELSEPCAQPA